MENPEIKCPQLSFNTASKIIFMKNSPIQIYIAIQSPKPEDLCFNWTIMIFLKYLKSIL